MNIIIIFKRQIFWVTEMLHFSTQHIFIVCWKIFCLPCLIVSCLWAGTVLLIFELLLLWALSGPWGLQLGFVEMDEYSICFIYIFNIYINVCVYIYNLALVLIIIDLGLLSLYNFAYKYIRFWIFQPMERCL